MTRSTIASSLGLALRSLAVVVPLVLTVSIPAAAAAPTPDAALAETLFREGRKLMSAGRFTEACPKLAESQRIDPGGGTLLNLGICHAKAGKTASAWAELKEALGVARRDGRADREEIAKKELAALEPRLSRLTVVVPEEARVVGLELTLDGAPLSPAAWGSAFPINPGDHKLEATAPARERFIAKLAIQPELATARVTVPKLSEARAQKSAPASMSPAPPPVDEGGSGGAQRTVAFILGGVGLGAIGVGIGFGVHALSLESSARLEGCQGATCTMPEGVDLSRAANRSAHISTATIAGGATLMATGALLLALSPGRARPAPRAVQFVPVAGPPGAGVLLLGSF